MKLSRPAVWLALRIIRAVAVLVPTADRAEWRREWEAELQHRSAHLGRRPQATWRTDMDLITRALGSLPDAAWLRRQFTLDADAVHDVTHGVRLLIKTPGFTAIALLVFATGIGAATAMVSVADALFFRPLPVPDADRVMTIWQYDRDAAARQDAAPGNALDWMARARSFETMAVAVGWSVTSGREPGFLSGVRVSERFFDVIRTPMLHGRTFLPQEYKKGAAPVAILSYYLWRDQYGSDPGIIGRVVRINDTQAFTIVGVLPPGLELRLYDTRTALAEPVIWAPKPGVEDFEQNLRTRRYWTVVGRLRRDVSVGEAQAEFDALSAQLAREHPQANKNVVAQVLPLRAHLVGSLRHVLPLLLGAAAILLIVACANVANLLLARGVGRGREFAVRQALGASRGRLVRQMLVESLLLATVGGALGLLLARWTLDVIARLRPLDAARIDQIPIDARAAAIACGVTIVAAIVAGLTPSLQLSRPAAATALRETRSSSRRGARGALVVVEVAAALVLAVGAGLLVRSFLLIQSVDPGFTPDRVSALQIFPSPRIETPAKRIVFFQQALDKFRALPGVVAAVASPRCRSASPRSSSGRRSRSAVVPLRPATRRRSRRQRSPAITSARWACRSSADGSSTRPTRRRRGRWCSSPRAP